jgi:hypothetical protein
MELVEGLDGRWGYKYEPTECPNGHHFGPGRVFMWLTPATIILGLGGHTVNVRRNQ